MLLQPTHRAPLSLVSSHFDGLYSVVSKSQCERQAVFFFLFGQKLFICRNDACLLAYLMSLCVCVFLLSTKSISSQICVMLEKKEPVPKLDSM